MTVRTFAPAGWKIIGVSNRMELTGEMENIARISLALILGLVVVILAGFFLSGRLTKPIKELQQTMRRAAESQYQCRRTHQ